MIYGRFGDEVQILREGTIEDVKTLDKRKPDKQDRDCLESCSYVVVLDSWGFERLYHLGFLRADGGFTEVVEAMRKVGIQNKVTAPR